MILEYISVFFFYFIFNYLQEPPSKVAKTDAKPEETKLVAVDTKPIAEGEAVPAKIEENQDEPMDVDPTEQVQETTLDKPEETKTTSTGT